MIVHDLVHNHFNVMVCRNRQSRHCWTKQRQSKVVAIRDGVEARGHNDVEALWGFVGVRCITFQQVEDSTSSTLIRNCAEICMEMVHILSCVEVSGFWIFWAWAIIPVPKCSIIQRFSWALNTTRNGYSRSGSDNKYLSQWTTEVAVTLPIDNGLDNTLPTEVTTLPMEVINCVCY